MLKERQIQAQEETIMQLRSKLTVMLAAGVGAFALVAAGPPPQAGESEQPAKVGERAPNFTLKDLDGKEHTLQKYLDEGKMVVLEWFNPDCPFVKKHHEHTRNMSETKAWAAEQGAVWFAVNSGAPGKQGTGVDYNKKARETFKMDYPILLDEQGVVGRAYGAKVSPDMRIITPEGVIIYAGAIDNDRSPLDLGEINYVRRAIEQHKAGETIEYKQTEPYGCSVKYARRGG